jgi:hypothetical protein
MAGASPRRQGKTFFSADIGRGKEICLWAGEKTTLLILSFGYRKKQRPYCPLSLFAKVWPYPVLPMESIIGIPFGRASLPAIASRSGEAGQSLGQIVGVCLRFKNLSFLFYDHFDCLGRRTHPPPCAYKVHSKEIDLSLNPCWYCAKKALLHDRLCPN